ncbi:MAG: (d)CMP kinase [Puniceicoccales bacterium]|jgi:cytidylate kinase|nr:(d)CMP kinase [Puniceicoccales bacterium]
MQETPKRFVTVAVDGGAAAGKSSTSRAVAERFGLMHVDTGAHYRTVALALTRAGISPGDTGAITAFLGIGGSTGDSAGDAVGGTTGDATARLTTVVEGRTARLAIDGVAPADAALRAPEINAVVSPFAAVPAVRQFLFAYQRGQVAVARERGFNGLVMEGRDIGSVILPDADLRVFLEADPEARAARRVAEGGVDAVAERDKRDSSRKTAPLVCPAGAVRIDNTHLSLAEVVEEIARLITALR